MNGIDETINSADREGPVRSRQPGKFARFGRVVMASAFVVAVVLFLAWLAKPRPGIRNNGPVDIRLLGVCPDGRPVLYSANGKKLDGPLPALGLRPRAWDANVLQRWFVCEIPPCDEQVFVLSNASIHLPGSQEMFRHFFVARRSDDTPSILVAYPSLSLPRKYRDKLLWFFEREYSVDRVDLRLEYFYGPRGSAQCTYVGPFTIGTDVTAQEGGLYRLTPLPTARPDITGIEFDIKPNLPFVSKFEGGVYTLDRAIIVYDKQGQRHRVYLVLRDAMRGSLLNLANGRDEDYAARDITWDQVAAITIGETPYEVVFTDVVVDYPKDAQQSTSSSSTPNSSASLADNGEAL